MSTVPKRKGRDKVSVSVRMASQFKLSVASTVALFTASALMAGGGAALSAVQPGNITAALHGELVHKAAKANRLTFVPMAQVAARAGKSDRIIVPTALFTGTDMALGGIFDAAVDKRISAKPTVNRLAKADRHSTSGMAQTVARAQKTDPIAGTRSPGTMARYAAMSPGAMDTGHAAANRSGKADRLSNSVVAQAVVRNRKADLTRIVVASLGSKSIETTAPRSTSHTVKPEPREQAAKLQEPMVFVPVNLVYNPSGRNLAETPLHNAVSKTLWD